MWTAFFATVLAPVVVLALDYIYRFESDLHELLEKSGPDLCLLSLGASVPVFLDSRVVAALGGHVAELEFVIIFGILLLRGFCFRFNLHGYSRLWKYTGLACGCGSIVLVGAILIFGYWKTGGG